MRTRSLLSVCLAVLFVLSANSQTTLNADSSHTEDVCETAFRYFLTHGDTLGAKAICISTAIPLPSNFISRFANSIPHVAWSIECASNFWAGIKYIKTNEPAVLVKIVSIRWVSGKEAEVNGGSVWGDFVRPPSTVRIVEKNGRWIVKSDKADGVS
jgi:hypothetical protein